VRGACPQRIAGAGAEPARQSVCWVHDCRGAGPCNIVVVGCCIAGTGPPASPLLLPYPREHVQATCRTACPSSRWWRSSCRRPSSRPGKAQAHGGAGACLRPWPSPVLTVLMPCHALRSPSSLPRSYRGYYLSENKAPNQVGCGDGAPHTLAPSLLPSSPFPSVAAADTCMHVAHMTHACMLHT
jgi:hypothetical protein